MRRRPITTFRPGVEKYEPKRLLSTGAVSSVLAHAKGDQGVQAATASQGAGEAVRRHQQPVAAAGLTLFRITGPKFPDVVQLHGPFQQIRVQSTIPKPGNTYNVLSLTVKNGTARTFDASSGFLVRLTGQSKAVPVLTGDQTWKPGEYLVFYALSKKYYPIRPRVSAGFEFNFAGNRAVAVPGPSGIFLRVKYDPDKFARLLDWIVVYGPAVKGHGVGLPDTALWELTSTLTNVEPL